MNHLLPSVLAPFVAMPFAPSSFLLLLVWPGAPSNRPCSVRSDATVIFFNALNFEW